MAVFVLLPLFSIIPFATYYARSENISFQLDWDDQVNFIDNILLNDNHGSFIERASLATSSSGIFLGVWEPVSMWLKICIAHFSHNNNNNNNSQTNITQSIIKIDIFIIFGIILHVLNGLLLLTLVNRLQQWIYYEYNRTPTTTINSQKSKTSSSHTKGWQYGSFIGVLIWCIHPLKVETICWMSCLPYINAMFFSLLSFHMLLSINLHSLYLFNFENDDNSNNINNNKDTHEIIKNKNQIIKNKNISKKNKEKSMVLKFKLFIYVLLFTFFYICAITSKAASLPLLGVYLVFQVFISTLPSSSSTTSVFLSIWSCFIKPVLLFFSAMLLVAMWGIKKAIWANSIGMKITEEHPQNALKIPRHLEMDGFALGSEGSVPEGLLSANWWWEKSFSHKLAKACYSLTWYLERTVFPKHLCIFYPVDKEFSAEQVSLLSLVVGLMTVTSVLFTLRMLVNRVTFNHSPRSTMEYASITWLCFIGVLFPTLGIVFEHGWPIFGADRYSYIPSALLVPWVAAVGSRVALALSKMSSARRTARCFPLSFLTSSLLCCLCFQSSYTASKWENSTSLWQHATAYGPKDVVAHYNLGCVYEREGKLKEASSLFEQALAIDSSYGAAWNNWGFIRETMKDYSGAEHCYRKAIALNGDRHYTAHNNMAKLLHMHGSEMKRKNRVQSDAQEIIYHYNEAIRIFPQYGKALYNLATYFHTLQPEILKGLNEAEFSTSSYQFNSQNFDLFDETAGLYRQAITVAPQLYESYHNLASLLLTHHSSILRTQEAASMLIEGRRLLDYAMATFPSYDRPKQLLPLVDDAWRRLPQELKHKS